ncbi:uncharacterized protein LOC125500727 [Athalia rosae]|uniref:uncharacterized protein LOC125500727 n=1 Tax=Athalia rosae TaxID=37344 RepID=UPI002033811E|nr:uncharacterized protein LOC125500727 [Athalia rosae]
MAEEMQIEENLDRDFLLFMSLTKTYFPQIDDQRHKTLCTQWLSKLCGEKVEGISQKRNRNWFLSHLLMYMQERKVAGPFLKPPADGALPKATAVFGPPPAEESIIDDGENLIGENKSCVTITWPSIENFSNGYKFES